MVPLAIFVAFASGFLVGVGMHWIRSQRDPPRRDPVPLGILTTIDDAPVVDAFARSSLMKIMDTHDVLRADHNRLHVEVGVMEQRLRALDERFTLKFGGLDSKPRSDS